MMTLATRPIVRWGEVGTEDHAWPQAGHEAAAYGRGPGLVHVTRWRPDNPRDAEHAGRIAAYGGLGRKS
jgi:hypothetical protein